MADDKQTATSFGLMKYVHLTFMAGAVVGGWLLTQIVNTVWTSLNLTWVEVPAPSMAVSVVIGGGVAVAIALYLWRHPQINKIVVEIVTELSKVTWPTRKELSSSTVVVVVVSIIAALILGAFDAFWSWVTGFIY
ncbi:MAG: preprotein translocase subunit SecE [Deltaproteobacteria bacterium]|nr:preprotein translocase subunit SecE [Deltaproteobacteria bacterium]MBN2672959.1 preprotein translocase subunit SecE [Deltaproteobacteria bacterium]